MGRKMKQNFQRLKKHKIARTIPRISPLKTPKLDEYAEYNLTQNIEKFEKHHTQSIETRQFKACIH